MGRRFGTDGIRGIANVELTPPLAYALGRAVAVRLAGPGGRLLVGQDTRRSGDMLVAAITAGATSLGVDVHRVGVLPTPALAFLAGAGDFPAAIMVSASHNPAEDNGLKVIGGRGLKLDDAVEEELEALIDRSDELGSPGNADLGVAVDARALVERYVEDRSAIARRCATTLHVVLDCANGAASDVAPRILGATGARVEALHRSPDGVNINVACGATAPEDLAAEVVRRGADLGIALDGDADRCVAVDAGGSVVDGDRLIGLLALDRLARGELGDGTVVVSVLSNGGLAAAVERAGGRVVRTPVGDRYILEAMQASGARLGGEKSGHVIVMDRASTGDGIVTALETIGVLGRRRTDLAALAAEIPLFPQEQRTIRVARKGSWAEDDAIVAAIAEAERALGPGGRVLVRPSGTEPALRVMVEGADAAVVAAHADRIAALAGERLH